MTEIVDLISFKVYHSGPVKVIKVLLFGYGDGRVLKGDMPDSADDDNDDDDDGDDNDDDDNDDNDDDDDDAKYKGVNERSLHSFHRQSNSPGREIPFDTRPSSCFAE